MIRDLATSDPEEQAVARFGVAESGTDDPEPLLLEVLLEERLTPLRESPRAWIVADLEASELGERVADARETVRDAPPIGRAVEQRRPRRSVAEQEPVAASRLDVPGQGRSDLLSLIGERRNGRAVRVTVQDELGALQQRKPHSFVRAKGRGFAGAVDELELLAIPDREGLFVGRLDVLVEGL